MLNLSDLTADLGSPLDFPTPITFILAHNEPGCHKHAPCNGAGADCDPFKLRVVALCTCVRLTDSHGQPLGIRGVRVSYPDGAPFVRPLTWRCARRGPHTWTRWGSRLRLIWGSKLWRS